VNQAIRQIGSVLGVVVVIALVGTARGPGALRAFTHVFLLLALGGFSTALISAAIDTRPRAVSTRDQAQWESTVTEGKPPDRQVL
jgi:hypothetical protein